MTEVEYTCVEGRGRLALAHEYVQRIIGAGVVNITENRAKINIMCVGKVSRCPVEGRLTEHIDSFISRVGISSHARSNIHGLLDLVRSEGLVEHLHVVNCAIKVHGAMIPVTADPDKLNGLDDTVAAHRGQLPDLLTVQKDPHNRAVKCGCNVLPLAQLDSRILGIQEVVDASVEIQIHTIAGGQAQCYAIIRAVPPLAIDGVLPRKPIWGTLGQDRRRIDPRQYRDLGQVQGIRYFRKSIGERHGLAENAGGPLKVSLKRHLET